jgi:hypothetical protein
MRMTMDPRPRTRRIPRGLNHLSPRSLAVLAGPRRRTLEKQAERRRRSEQMPRKERTARRRPPLRLEKVGRQDRVRVTPPGPTDGRIRPLSPGAKTSNGKIPSPGKFSVLSGMARRFRGGENDLCPLLGHESSLGSLSVGLVALGADLLATKASSRVQSLLSICARPAMRTHCVSRIERRHQTRAPCLAYATKSADAHGGTVFSAGRGHHGPAPRCSGSPKA